MPEQKNIDTVSIKLPSFWITNPTGWFAQAEAQFGLRGITTDQTKFWHLVSALDSDASARVSSLLQNPPDDDKYPALKKHLLDAFDLSEEERARRLFAISDLGDLRPSELADRIMHLNGDSPMHFCLRHIFLRALPPAARHVLSASKITDLRALGMEADRIVSSSEGISSINDTDHELNALQKPRRTQRQLCYFHRTYGPRARRCQAPCDWKPYPGNAGAGSR